MLSQITAMSRRLNITHRSRAATAISAALVLALSALVACGGPTSEQAPSAASSEKREAPASFGFARPREVIAKSGGTEAALVTFEATPEHIAVFYAVAGETRFAGAAPKVSLLNDKGEIYETLSNVSIGAPEGVFLGLLVTEPYRPGAPALSLQIGSLTDETGQQVPLHMLLPVATRSAPDELVRFVEGGRYGHDDGIRLSDATVGVAGPPAPARTHALVVRNGSAASTFGEIDSAGLARPVAEEEYGFKAPLPPDFPWPENVSY